MVLIDVSGTSAIVRKQDDLTRGMVGATVTFCFSDDWNNLSKTVVFRAGKVTKDATVMDSVAKIPHEVLEVYGLRLEIGVYGTANSGALVVPTIWAKTAPIKPGTDPSGDESLDPSLPVWAQMQEQLDAMYRSSGEIKAAKEELMQAIEDAKEDLDDIVAAGGYYSKTESGTKLASAIHGKLSGSIVAADDVSPAEHFLSVKAHGKNLVRIRTTEMEKATNGITFTRQSDGTIMATGTATATAYYLLHLGSDYASQIPIAKGKYVVSKAPAPGCRIVAGLRMFETDDRRLHSASFDNEAVFEVTTNTARFDVILCVDSGATVNGAVFKPQIEKGETATDYEAYIDPSTVTAYRYGKNLIQYPFAYTARTTNGVTFTPKADGTVVVNGIASANTYFALNGGFSADAAQIPCTLKPGEEYTITDAMVFLYKDGETKAFNEGTFTMPEGYDYYGIFVYVPSGTTVAEVRRPQLELGGNATDFEPYTSASYVPLADGTVENVTSLAPCMTFAADRDDMFLQVEYNRDTNKVIEELLALITPATRVTSVKLLASKWTGSGSLYSQVVSIPGITEYSQVNLAPSVEQMATFYEKDLTFVTENDGGVVTVYVIGQKPQNDYTIQADIVEVIA